MKPVAFKVKPLFLKTVEIGKLLQNIHYIQITIEKVPFKNAGLSFLLPVWQRGRVCTNK